MNRTLLKTAALALLTCAAAPLSAQTFEVDCQASLQAYALSNPELLGVCHCVANNQPPVCGSGGDATGGQPVGLSGFFDFNRLSPFGPETGNSFFSLRYGESFRDWSDDARERWQAYLIRNRLAKAGITVWPNNPAAALVEWFYKVLSGLNRQTARVSLFPTLTGDPVSKAVADYEGAVVDPIDLKKDDPVIGPLASAVPDSNELNLGGDCANCASIAPGYALNYSSLYGGQYEALALKVERFQDGRAVFTDASNTRWTFRPYGVLGEGDNYYRPPLGSAYRLVYGGIAGKSRGYRVESADGDVIEFSSGAAENQWRPSRYNAADGSWLTYAYGPNGLARITDMHGRYFAFERDAKGLPAAVTDEQGRKTSFSYDQQGRAVGVTGPDGSKKSFGYSGGLLTSLKNGALAEERYTYDETGRLLTSESEGGVNRREHFYNDRSSRTVIADALGSRTTYVYKNEGGRKLPVAVTDALGNTSYLGYDADYNVAVTTDALGRAARYARNPNGDPVAITDALGHTSTIQYQVKLNYKDAAGEHTDYYSRPIRITDALGRVTKLDYDSYGNLAKAVDAGGNTTSMDYDKAGHMLALRDAAGATYRYDYTMGLAKTTDPLGRVTRYKRDADLRVTALTDPLGRNTSFTYDLGGNVTEVRNPADLVTRFAYGDGGCPSCGGSQLSALTDPKGNTWTFGYDQYGRLTQTANPLGQRKAYGYDKMSRVTEVKDPAGNVTVYSYDALGRLTGKTIRTADGRRGDVKYTYDAVGNLLAVTDDESAVEFAYDALNRAVETRQSFAGKTYTIGYGYDAVGNRTFMQTPWGKYSYTYDALNRAESITNPQGIVVSFRYDAAGRRTEKSVFSAARAPLASTRYSYDAAGQLLSIVNKAGDRTVAFANYTYDALGNRVSMEDQHGTHTYAYDAANRLIVARDLPLVPFRGEGFAYDKAGNRRHDTLAKDYKYDAANRLQENTLYTYTHDLNGNLTSRTEKASTATITYAYNPENQLSSVITPEAKVEYKYDPLGRRIEKTVNASALRYVYDNEDIIAILDGNNALTQTFTHGPGIDEPLVLNIAGDINYYYHADGLGSIAALSDDNGQTFETFSYNAYGSPVVQKQSVGILKNVSLGNPFLFTAREFDKESGLLYLRNRYADLLSGRFMQEDPIGFKGGDVNLYAYVSNNPGIYTDSSGLFLDTLLDLYFISDDVKDVSRSIKCGDKDSLKVGLIALGLDIVGASVPGVTGLGKGFKIGFTKHSIDRIISREIAPKAILDALKTPLKTGPVIRDTLGRPTQKLTGQYAEIIINPETGKIITAWPTSTVRVRKIIGK